MTEHARSWLAGLGTYFDVLPLMIDSPYGPTFLQELPTDAVLQVPITHPSCIGSRPCGCAGTPSRRFRTWTCTSAASPMAPPRSTGGTGTEIGARNFAMWSVQPAADHCAHDGLDTSSERTLCGTARWSSSTSPCCIPLPRPRHHDGPSHRGGSVHKHLDARRSGREVPGDWSWLYRRCPARRPRCSTRLLRRRRALPGVHCARRGLSAAARSTLTA